MFKHTVIAAAIAGSLVGVNAHASSGVTDKQAKQAEYVYRTAISQRVNIPQWIIMNYLYAPWQNINALHSCTPWQPDVSTIDLGTTFQQNRSCLQSQERLETPVLYNPVLRTSKHGESRIGAQNISVTQYQAATGIRDFIDGEQALAWSSWTDTGAHYACAPWDPTPDTVNLDAAFVQERACSQDQGASRQVVHTWASGKTTPKRLEERTQTISEIESRPSIGTKDFINGERIGTWSAWSVVGGNHSCDPWSPATSTVNLGVDFEQSRDCQQNQTRERSIYDTWKSGREDLARVETGNQTITIGETQPATGTKDFITGTLDYGTWSPWGVVSNHSHTAWSPAENTVNFGEIYTQSRDYQQVQTRSRQVYDVWASGKTTDKKVDTENRTVTLSENRPATGDKDYITGTSYGDWSSWSDISGAYGFSGWSKSCSSYSFGSSFTNSRTYKVDQSRTRTKYHTWASGKAPTAYGTDTGTQTDTRTQTDSQTGCADYIVGSTYGSWTGWSNDGGGHSYSDYSPSTSTVNWGQSFTQTSSYVQPLVRTRSVYDVWASGGMTFAGTDEGYSSTTVTDTRPAVGTKDYVASTGTDYGSWSTYTTSCTSWSPSASSQPGGLTFTQTRSCTPKQRRTVRAQYNWASGATTYGSTSYAYQDLSSYTMSQSATGTGAVTAIGSSSTTGPTYNYGSPSCSGWSPSQSNYYTFESFSQTRSCTQARRYNKTVTTQMSDGSTQTSTTTHTASSYSYTESRTVSGSKVDTATRTIEYGAWSSWSNTSCTPWVPETYNFSPTTRITQYRECDQTRTRTYVRYDVYESGRKVRLGSGTSTGTQTVQETRSTWGSGSCGEWGSGDEVCYTP
jgi:hypothetical protein